MGVTFTKLTSSSYQLKFLSYTESDETRSLLLPFDQFNSNSSNNHITPPTTTPLIFKDSTAAQAVIVVGFTTRAMSNTASTLLVHIQSKGASAQLIRILQIMARINFMRLSNILHLWLLSTTILT